MRDKEQVGFRVDELVRCLRRATNTGVERSGISPIVIQRGWIIGYIKHHPDDIICQCDVEARFHLPKSTATDTLKVLEREGVIMRVPLENDARRKRIVLTEKGYEFSQITEEQIDLVESYIKKDINQEELEIFLKVLNKLKQNALDYKDNVEKKEDK